MQSEVTSETTETTKRISFEIPEELHRRLKSTAASEGKSIKDFGLEILTEALPVSAPEDPSFRQSRSVH